MSDGSGGCCRVLKEVHPDVGISKQGMQVMQTFAVDMFDRIMVEASRLCRISNKATLSSREIQTAGKLPILDLPTLASALCTLPFPLPFVLRFHALLFWW